MKGRSINRKANKWKVAFAAAIMLVSLMVPMTAAAEEYVARVDGVKYTDYKEAWKAVKDGGTITLLSDWKTAETLKVSKKSEVTIKANGHTIDRGLSQVAEDQKSDGTVLSIGENSVLNIYDGTVTGGNSQNHSGGIYVKKKARVNLYNVKVTGNSSYLRNADGCGGGVMLDGENAYLYMYDSCIDNNKAAEDGGGIYISDYKKCTVELAGNSSISNNCIAEEDEPDDDCQGGGIYINGDDAKIIGHTDENGQPTSKISGNSSFSDGGGIYVNGDKAIIKNVEISGNTAGQDGGGIYADNEDGCIEGCVIKDNNLTSNISLSTYEGGGVFIDNDGWKIKDCTITGNKALDQGGGVFVTFSADIALEGDVIIKDNVSGDNDKKDDLYLNVVGLTKACIKDPAKITGEAGSIGIRSGKAVDKRRISAKAGEYDETVFFSDDERYDVRWDYDAANKEGSKLLKLRKAYVAEVDGTKYTDCEKAMKEVKDGGTITMLADWKTGDTIEVIEGKNVTIKGDGHVIDRGLAQKKDSERDGTVLSVEKNAVLNMYDGTVTGGCSDTHSSGIHIKENARVNLYNVNVTENRSEEFAGDGHGGGVMLDGESAYLYMYNSHIDNNYTEQRGGGVYISDVKNCTVELDGISTISNNKARDSHGGAIFINGQNAKIVGHTDENGQPKSKISGNTTDNDGGAIYVNSEKFLVKNVEISGNVSDVDGGGIYADNEDGTIEGCVIKDNKTKTGVSREGGGVYIDNDGWKIKDCTITHNTADDNGGGVFVTCTADIDLEGNVVIKENTAGGKANDLRLNYDGFLVKKALIIDPGKITSAPGSIGINVDDLEDANDKSIFDSTYFDYAVTRVSRDTDSVDCSIFFANDEENKDYVDVKTKNGKYILVVIGYYSEPEWARMKEAAASSIKGKLEASDTAETEATENSKAGEEGSNVCECAESLTEEELIKAAEETFASEKGYTYLLEDGTTKVGSIEERFSDVILIKCPDCGENIEINIDESEGLDKLLLDVEQDENPSLAGTMMNNGSIYFLIFAGVAAAGTAAVIAVKRRRERT